ncbi:hypothetical protein GCM10010912_22260 [Paenibacillus albidus]|uniref:Uncharacterized protein n=1 Tax=Paenibacillus albidus TaxID=2041023 RepID=A0A917C8P3_9BACL|nr:hypothetical protein [Paenibacillus albidus]GGF76695.1 hypothetical protein GCM10010912_22260 [Paenibacillus albidus]
MSSLIVIARNLNDSLTDYTTIHDGIFKKTLRKTVPIPFLFKAINFQELEQKLQTVHNDLSRYKTQVNDIRQSGSEDINKCNIFIEYVDKLIYAVQLLQGITRNLFLKSQGDNTYKLSEHTELVKRYETAVDAYYSLGDKMNSVFS